MLSGEEVLKKAGKYDFEAVKEYLEQGGDAEVFDRGGNSLLSALLRGYYTEIFENDPDEIRFYAEHEEYSDEWRNHVFRYCRMPLEERPHPIRDQVEWLIGKGIGVNAVGWKEARQFQKFAPSVESPLMHAVEHRDYCMIKFLLENGADPCQRLFTDGFYDDLGYEPWLVEHMDVMIMDEDAGDSMMLDLEIASLLMHYGLDQWEGGLCIDVDKENRSICGHGLRLQH